MLRDLGLKVCNYSACHCEERSDEAIPHLAEGDCFASLAMTGRNTCQFQAVEGNPCDS